MKICPKCGSIMLPKKEGGGVLLSCNNCGHKESGESKITEKVHHHGREIEVAEKRDDIHPTTKTKCPKCGHDEAYFWEVQTRSPDEAATAFFKCKKCSNIWREYK